MQVHHARPFSIVVAGAGCWVLALSGWAWADTPEPPAGATGAQAEAPLPPSPPVFEGALGPVVSWSHQGHGVDAKPGFYFRYKRLSLSNTSSFAVRRSDDLFRGLGLDMVNSERVTFNLGLRFDRGGRTSDLPALAGHDKVEATVRLRASATYHLTPRWSVGAGWTTDLLGHGGGQTVDLGISHERPLGPRLVWSMGAGLNAANATFQRSYFGVTPTQSALSGLPVYTPGGGLMNASVGTTLRKEIGNSWVAFVGASAVHRLGPQVDSPLVTWSNNWGMTAGIARRF